MTYGRKTGGKNFKPGIVTNPKGRPKIPQEIKEIRKMVMDDICRGAAMAREMTPEQLKNIDMDKVPMGLRYIISAYKNRDARAIKDIEDRVAGKAPEHVQISGPDNGPIEIDDYNTKQALIEKLKGLNGNVEGNINQ